MSWQLRWARPAVQDLNNLDPPAKKRIVSKVERFASTGHGDVAKLRGYDQDRYRLRVGDWRVLFSYELEGEVLLVRRVAGREDAY